MAQSGGIHVVKLRRLRNELRQAREAAGLTQKQVAEDMGWSMSKMIRLETGAGSITTADVMALLHEYQITDAERANGLIAITRQKDRAWWWDEYKEIFETDFPHFLNFLAFEDSASRIRHYHGLLIPGLLQAERYIRAILHITDDPDVMEAGVQVRLRRQELLHQPAPPEIFALIDEGVVRRVIGGHDVMIEQLSHLKALNEQPHITIQVVPFAAGMVTGMSRPFSIYDLSGTNEGEDLDYVVEVEDIFRDTLVRDSPDVTRHYVEAFHEIREIALSVAETNQLLASIITEISAHQD